MRKLSIVIFFLLTLIFSIQAGSASETHQKPPQTSVEIPCSLILEPTNKTSVDTKGIALFYKVFHEHRTDKISLSIHAMHLPDPKTAGDYDGFEGFAQTPGIISWRFRLYPTPEPDGPTWAGRLDEISGALSSETRVQVRLSNSKTKALGPVILQNTMGNCRPISAKTLQQ